MPNCARSVRCKEQIVLNVALKPWAEALELYFSLPPIFLMALLMLSLLIWPVFVGDGNTKLLSNGVYCFCSSKTDKACFESVIWCACLIFIWIGGIVQIPFLRSISFHSALTVLMGRLTHKIWSITALLTCRSNLLSFRKSVKNSFNSFSSVIAGYLVSMPFLRLKLLEVGNSSCKALQGL